jgi:hypothetical protein
LETQNPDDVEEYKLDSLKLNMYRLTNAGVIEPFFREKMVTDAVYLDMLENNAVLQVPDG